MNKAMFGAGCFWGVQHAFKKIPGVLKTFVGYSGGHLENPTYRLVCEDNTGHAEVVWVEFDPAQVSFKTLLEAFFKMHNPTTLNRQGPDEGSQYRSAIYYYDEDQKKEALQARADAQKFFKDPIVTEVRPAQTFWKAEDYHQDYFDKHGEVCGH